MLCAYDQACLACVDSEGVAGFLGWVLTCFRISGLMDGATAVPSVRRIMRVPEGVTYGAHDAVPGLVLWAGA